MSAPGRSSGVGLGVLVAVCVALGIGLERFVFSPEMPGAPVTYLSRLAEDLDLTPEQIAAVARVLDEEDRDLRTLTDSHADAMKAPVAQRRHTTEAAILALLDEGQRTRYEEITGG